MLVDRSPVDRRRRLSAPSPALQTRIRSFIDRYQVLCLTHPIVARWLIDWVDLFISKHLAE